MDTGPACAPIASPAASIDCMDANGALDATACSGAAAAAEAAGAWAPPRLAASRQTHSLSDLDELFPSLSAPLACGAPAAVASSFRLLARNFFSMSFFFCKFGPHSTLLAASMWVTASATSAGDASGSKARRMRSRSTSARGSAGANWLPLAGAPLATFSRLDRLMINVLLPFNNRSGTRSSGTASALGATTTSARSPLRFAVCKPLRTTISPTERGNASACASCVLGPRRSMLAARTRTVCPASSRRTGNRPSLARSKSARVPCRPFIFVSVSPCKTTREPSTRPGPHGISAPGPMYSNGGRSSSSCADSLALME
mmetsp:Transcript_62239/g.180494  ORF Transcript_62239/g.180494 Transcript_62239/m.180494 type:complete len:316 (+) Transcript_62239:350-1297(+)